MSKKTDKDLAKIGELDDIIERHVKLGVTDIESNNKHLMCSPRLRMLRPDKLIKMDEANIPGTERDAEFYRELGKRFGLVDGPKVVTIMPPIGRQWNGLGKGKVPQLPFTLVDENTLDPEFLNDDITKMYPNDVRDSPVLMKLIKKRETIGGKDYYVYSQHPEFVDDLFPKMCEMDSMSEYQPPATRKPRDLLDMKNHGALSKKSFPKQKHKRY